MDLFSILSRNFNLSFHKMYYRIGSQSKFVKSKLFPDSVVTVSPAEQSRKKYDLILNSDNLFSLSSLLVAFVWIQLLDVTSSPHSGVNFTNILRKAFPIADPKSAKRLTAWLYFLRFLDLDVIPTFYEHILCT